MEPAITPPSPRASIQLVIGIFAMIAIPAALTLHTARVPPQVDRSLPNLTPYGYTLSLLLFLVPIATIAIWFLPKEGVVISKKSFWQTIALLFPLGAGLDFFFAHRFFTFPNVNATLRVTAPALGGGVPVEEYIFYLTGFVAVLLIYVWLDEYWLAAYSVAVNAEHRIAYDRLLRFHPWSLLSGAILIAGGLAFRLFLVGVPGLPGYFVFIVLVAFGPATGLLPAALPVINWRAFSLTFFLILLISLLWEATLALPYGWWAFNSAQTLGITITAWSRLPIEEVMLWCAVTYSTVIVYEVVRRWKTSGRSFAHAMFGSKTPRIANRR